MDPRDDQFLTTEQVLEYLHLNLKTVYRLINAGKIPAIKVGHQWRFRKRDLDLWLAANAKGATTRAEPVDRASVLVVDDDEGARHVIVAALETAGRYQVLSAGDGPSALAMIRAQRFDLLVADLQMPHMDGLALVRQARTEAPHMPAVIITAASTEESAIEAISLGVSGYILKPFRVAQILEAVDKALSRQPAS